MTPMTNDELIASARRWANIYHHAKTALYHAMGDPFSDREMLRDMDTIVSAAHQHMQDRFRSLTLLGLGDVARSIHETRHTAPGTMPESLRLAEAPIGAEVAGG